MSIRHMKKEIPGSHYFFLCTEQFTDTNLFTFLHTGQLFFWKCKMYIYYYICFPLCAHILYFDEAKFSIKLVYFTVSVVRQRNEYEIVSETRPIKTRVHNQLSLPRCSSAQKIMIIALSSDEIKYTQDKDNSCAVISAILACKIREAT